MTKGQTLTTWILGTIVASGAAIGVLHKAFTTLVTEARAQEIAQSQVAPALQKIYEQDVKRERGELNSQIQIARLRISYLNSKSARTADEDEELRSLRAQIDAMQIRLRELDNK